MLSAPNNNNDGQWVGGMRIRRHAPAVRRVEDYRLAERNEGMTPFGVVAKVINKAILSNKNKTEAES